MENIEKDILNSTDELKKMPFTTPQGYFEGINDSVASRIRASSGAAVQGEYSSRPVIARLTPYLAMAAMFAMIVCAGSLFLRVLSPEDAQEAEFADMSYLDIIPVTDPDMIYYAGNYDPVAISDEDITEYLIYSGVNIESLITE